MASSLVNFFFFCFICLVSINSLYFSNLSIIFDEFADFIHCLSLTRENGAAVGDLLGTTADEERPNPLMLLLNCYFQGTKMAPRMLILTWSIFSLLLLAYKAR